MVDFLTSRYTSQDNTNKKRNLITQWGTPQQKVFLLLEENKIEEAITIARQHFF